jgi:PTH1 family peptidyl-tRNA hydrolase
MSKFLIVGLGNIGEEYSQTRHNIGFEVADALAASLVKKEDDKPAPKKLFVTDKLAFVNHSKYKGKNIVIIKPTTYMNLSGKAVNYWMQAEKISLSHVLVVADDLALTFGTLRLRGKGGDGGHNGFTSIIEHTGSGDFPRLRFGIGSEFSRGHQVDYVLGKWGETENKTLPERIQMATEIIKSFVAVGTDLTMSAFNNK